MVFRIIGEKDLFLEKIYRDSMKALDLFFGLDWRDGIPNLIIVSGRKDIDQLFGTQTEKWVVGWLDGRNVFILDRNNYEKESCNKYSDEEYSKMIRHELVHAFFGVLSDGKQKPSWLCEGRAVYLSGQNVMFARPEKLSSFLGYYDRVDAGTYRESGFAVELLVKAYGKQKLLRLIKSLGEINSRKALASKFKEIYGTDLNYSNFNKLLKGERV